MQLYSAMGGKQEFAAKTKILVAIGRLVRLRTGVPLALTKTLAAEPYIHGLTIQIFFIMNP